MSDLNLLHEKSVKPIGWLVLVFGGLAASASAGFLWQQFSTIAEIQSENSRREALAATQLQQLNSLKIDKSPSYLLDPRWTRAATELTWPWHATLRELDAMTKSPVFLTAFKPTAKSGQITLEAEAPSFQEAVKYVKALSKSNKLSNVFLLNHETITTPQGATAIKFSVQVQWLEHPA